MDIIGLIWLKQIAFTKLYSSSLDALKPLLFHCLFGQPHPTFQLSLASPESEELSEV